MHTLQPEIKPSEKWGPSPSDDFVGRMIAFWSSLDRSKSKTSQIWDGVLAYGLGAITEEMESKSVRSIKSTLENCYSGRLLTGMDLIESQWDWNTWQANVVAAAVGLGVIPEYNPEQPNPTYIDYSQLIPAMEVVLKTRIDHVGFKHMPGVEIGDRFIPYKLTDAINASTPLMRFCWTGRSDILEIGGGCGYLCYWINRSMGSKSYHIIDIPEVAIIQSWLIACSIGECNLSFGNEDFKCSVIIHGSDTSWVEEESLDLVINQNSFPEIHPEKRNEYLGIISSSLKRGGYFYSENHESDRSEQERVFSAMNRVNNLVQIWRWRSMFRTGYVNEMWRKE